MSLFKKTIFSVAIVFQFFFVPSVFAATQAECDAINCAPFQAAGRENELEQCNQRINTCLNQLTTSTGPSLDERSVPADYGKNGIPAILPDCAFNAYGCTGEDADIGIFVRLGVNIAQVIFSVIGTIAFVMFVYGGFTMILSFGSSEKFKKGRDILVAAVVGMLIAFGAYLLVDFVLDALQVGQDFRVIK